MGKLLMRRREMSNSSAPEPVLINFDGTYYNTSSTDWKVIVTDGNVFAAKRRKSTWSHQCVSVYRSDGEPWFTIPNGSTLYMEKPTSASMGYAHNGMFVCSAIFDLTQPTDSRCLVGQYGTGTNYYRSTYKNTTGQDVKAMAINFRIGGNGGAVDAFTKTLELYLDGKRIC